MDKSLFKVTLCFGFFLSSLFGSYAQDTLRTSDVRVRDPFVIVSEGKYYIIASDRPGLKAYESSDLKNWVPRGRVSEMPDGYLGIDDWWAPDTYFYRGHYYVFVTVANHDKGILRGTTVLKSDGGVLGPYRPAFPKKKLYATPKGYQCLDGSLYIDGKGRPWMIYCVEWNGPNVENEIGEVWAIRLKKNFKGTRGKGRRLFKASEAPWIRHDGSMVTDAPFIITDPSTGNLIMIWSSFGPEGSPRYRVGQAVSEKGLFGPWKHIEKPILDEDGGHAMVFTDLDGRMKMSYHRPNSRTETLTIRDVAIQNGLIEVINE